MTLDFEGKLCYIKSFALLCYVLFLISFLLLLLSLSRIVQVNMYWWDKAGVTRFLDHDKDEFKPSPKGTSTFFKD